MAQSNIKAHLHNYLGCDALVEKSDYHMVHNRSVHTGDIIQIAPWLLHHVHNVETLHAIIKPILRPVSEMTDQEKTDSPKAELDKLGNITFQSMAEVINYLRSISIDVDGLIEAGLAIDRNTVVQAM